MRKRAFIYLVSFLSFGGAFAQGLPPLDSVIVSEKRFAIGFSTGTVGLVVRDRVISNYLYKGATVPVSFGFEVNNRFNKTWFGFTLMNSPKLKTETNKGFAYKGDFGESFPNEKDGLDFSTLKTKMFFVNFTSLYMLKKTQNSMFRTYLGYDININSFKKTFLQFEYVNELSDRITRIGFVANFERVFNPKHTLQYTISLPILSYTRRSLYNQESDPRTISESKFNKVLGFESRFDYRFQVAARFSLRATYAFQYLQVSFPEKEQWAYNQGTIGAYFHF